MKSSSVAIAILCATLAQLLWAGNFAAGRAVRGAIDPINLNFLRWAMTAVLLSPILIKDRVIIFQTLRKMPAEIALLALLSVTLFNMLLYFGLQGATTAEAGIIVGLSPILILVLSHFFGSHKLGLPEIGGGFVAFGGAMLVLFGNPNASGTISGVTSPLFLAGAATVWALYTVLYQRFKIPMPALTAMAVLTAIGTIFMLPFLGLSPTPLTEVDYTQDVVLALGYITLCASLMAFFFWQIGMGTLGPARVAPFLQLIPVFTMILGVLLLGETVKALQIIGLGFVLGGVILAQRKRRS